MEKKEMKNIKKPSYACEMGNGVFVGPNWMCIKCGKQYGSSSSMPGPQYTGKCPDTASGNHVWQQC